MRKPFGFRPNKQQAELWSDKILDLANLILTGALISQGFPIRQMLFL